MGRGCAPPQKIFRFLSSKRRVLVHPWCYFLQLINELNWWEAPVGGGPGARDPRPPPKSGPAIETALVCVINLVLCSVDCGDVCALVLLDLSAAFDTLDHGHLLNVMHERFGIRGPVYNWFASCISGRSQAVTVNSLCSLPSSLVCGVPQTSVLGPVEFIIYTEYLVSVIDRLVTSPATVKSKSKCKSTLIGQVQVRVQVLFKKAKSKSKSRRIKRTCKHFLPYLGIIFLAVIDQQTIIDMFKN